MAFPTLYAALLSALSANEVPTELSGSGYARASTTLTYDDIAGVIYVPGFAFGPASANWTAATYLGLFDASSGGNLLMVWPISETVASGGSFAQATLAIATGVLVPSLARGAQAGTIIGTATEVIAGVALAYNAAAQTFGVAPNTGVPTAITYASAVTVNGALNNNFEMTLTGNCTMAVTNMVAGQQYSIELVQDGTGGRLLTLASGNGFKTAGGAPTLSTAANAIDRYGWLNDGTNNWGVLNKAFA